MGMLSMLAASASVPMGTALFNERFSASNIQDDVGCSCFGALVCGSQAPTHASSTSNVHACTKRTGLQ